GLSVDDNLSYLGEFEHITLAQVLIAQYQNDPATGSIHEAIDLLERLLQAAQAGRRMGSVIEILIMQSLAHAAQGNFPLARVPLERALALAEPEGYVRLFVDEGEAMQLLISDFRLQVEKRPRHPAGEDPEELKAYTAQLLAAFSKSPDALVPKLKIRNLLVPGSLQGKSEILPEPLSERELEVLKLLRSELNGPEIAQHLIVSLNTFRTHTKNIYNKLGVNDRRAAVRRAGELDLF
ncbi:MAG TPA: LuxR C-terminal-related transcriptional regulator, partial [Methylococcales bacterium]